MLNNQGRLPGRGENYISFSDSIKSIYVMNRVYSDSRIETLPSLPFLGLSLVLMEMMSQNDW